MKCVSHFLFYYFQYCVSKVRLAFECKPVLMFANEKALKKWGIRSTHFHKPIQMIRSTNVQLTTKAPISFNAVLGAVCLHKCSFGAINLFFFFFFLGRDFFNI